MSGADPVVTAATADSDEDALRCLEALVLASGMTTSYLAEMPRAAGDARAPSPGLMVFDSGRLEVARVVIARRDGTYLVSLFQIGERERLVPFRSAVRAAAMISSNRRARS